MTGEPKDQERKDEESRVEGGHAEKQRLNRLEKKFGWGPGDVTVTFPDKKRQETGAEKEKQSGKPPHDE